MSPKWKSIWNVKVQEKTDPCGCVREAFRESKSSAHVEEIGFYSKLQEEAIGEYNLILKVKRILTLFLI